MRYFSNWLLVVGIFLGSTGLSAADFDWTHESLGPLHFGMSRQELRATLGKPDVRAQPVFEEATGNWVTSWAWRKQGIDARTASPTQDGKGKVVYLSIRAPCTYQTSRGIKVGDTLADVERAYPQSLWDKEGEQGSSNDSVVVGSIYGGLAFDLKGGKVTRISIGAFAE